MRIVGLTGGIATGKSTVGSMFAALGAAIVDADAFAHQVVTRGKQAWLEIVDRFGRDILQPDGQIDRKKLGQVIFNNAEQRAALNRIVHPAVFALVNAEVRRLAAAGDYKLAVLDIPLLFETDMQATIRPVIVVYVPTSIQLQRLMVREEINRIDALARIQSQWSIERKKAHADYVINNSCNMDHTQTQVQTLYMRLIDRLDNQQKKAIIRSFSNR